MMWAGSSDNWMPQILTAALHFLRHSNMESQLEVVAKMLAYKLKCYVFKSKMGESDMNAILN